MLAWKCVAAHIKKWDILNDGLASDVCLCKRKGKKEMDGGEEESGLLASEPEIERRRKKCVRAARACCFAWQTVMHIKMRGYFWVNFNRFSPPSTNVDLTDLRDNLYHYSAVLEDTCLTPEQPTLRAAMSTSTLHIFSDWNTTKFPSLISLDFILYLSPFISFFCLLPTSQLTVSTSVPAQTDRHTDKRIYYTPTKAASSSSSSPFICQTFGKAIPTTSSINSP